MCEASTPIDRRDYLRLPVTIVIGTLTTLMSRGFVSTPMDFISLAGRAVTSDGTSSSILHSSKYIAMADRRSNQRALPRFHSPRSEAAGLWRQQLRESFRLSHAPAFMPPTPASSIDWNAINKEYNYFTGGSPAAADYSDVLDSDDQSTDMATPSAAGGPSPATSPRLPSPPPFPEVQIGPKSPTSGTTGGNGSQDAEEKARIYKNASRRVRPGTKSEDWLFGPPLIPLSEVRA